MLGYTNRYLANKRRLKYTILPSSRKIVKNNMKLAYKRLKSQIPKKSKSIQNIIDGLKGELNCTFYDDEKLQSTINIMGKIRNRNINRETYYQLDHDYRYKSWFMDTLLRGDINLLTKELNSSK